MDTQLIKLDRETARELYQKYKTHLHYSTPLDQEIARTYQLIAQGRTVIRALESIKAVGLNAEHLPKLAICRADKQTCEYRCYRDGSGVMFATGANITKGSGLANNSTVIPFPAGSFPARGWVSARAVLPIIPLHMRPKRGIQNYHILWEAEWTPTPPRDPLLLRRVGKADIWLVVAAWDLTEVERAALAARLTS